MTHLNCKNVQRIGMPGLCLAPIMFLFSGCDISLQGIRGSGIAKSETREIAEFDQIQMKGVGTVNVEFGEKPALKVTCDDNLFEYIQTEVVDGVLKISFRESISPVTSLKFDVVTNKLKAVDVDGAAKLEIHSAKLDDLRLDVEGASTIIADGTANSLEIDVSGAAKIDANALHAKTVKISISGAGKADVYASETLDATISGAGVVNCLGKPKVTKNVSGAGKINVVE